APAGPPGSARYRCRRGEAYVRPAGSLVRGGRLELEALEPVHRLTQPPARATQRQSNVSFSRLAEAVAGRDHDAGLVEAARGQRGRAEPARHRHPDVERSRRRIARQPDPPEATHQDVAALAIHGPQLLDDPRITGERGDGGFLDRLEDPRVDVGLHLAEARDELRMADGESDTPAGHVERLRQGVV